MPYRKRDNKESGLNKIVVFGKQFFASVIRSRKGILREMCTLLRFQPGTKGFERRLEYLTTLVKEIKDAFKQKVIETFPSQGLRLGIFDDSLIKKAGKKFPKQKLLHDHTTHSYHSGMQIFSSAVYQGGKMAVVSSKLVGKGENKLAVAKEEVDILVFEYFIDIILFDSWYCKYNIIDRIIQHNKIFVSRIRSNSVIKKGSGKKSLKKHAESIQHKKYSQVRIHGKSYWIYETVLVFKTYGKLRVIISKEGVNDKPVFLVTNTSKFTAKFIVMLYLKRFSIEIFFKDAKQFLNLESFCCRKAEKWELHLLLTNVLHWAIQTRNSISKIVRKIREDIGKCLVFINKNRRIYEFFERFKELCLT